MQKHFLLRFDRGVAVAQFFSCGLVKNAFEASAGLFLN